jgi:hypothetical protein
VGFLDDVQRNGDGNQGLPGVLISNVHHGEQGPPVCATTDAPRPVPFRPFA